MPSIYLPFLIAMRQITVAPPRKTGKKRGIFSKSNHVTHTHR